MIDELLFSQKTQSSHSVTIACFGWSLEEGEGVFGGVLMWPRGLRCPTQLDGERFG